jgi:hypothetical protein
MHEKPARPANPTVAPAAGEDANLYSAEFSRPRLKSAAQLP